LRTRKIAKSRRPSIAPPKARGKSIEISGDVWSGPDTGGAVRVGSLVGGRATSMVAVGDGGVVAVGVGAGVETRVALQMIPDRSSIQLIPPGTVGPAVGLKLIIPVADA
jgi:hypothetical protein